jgi:hypothetical protein
MNDAFPPASIMVGIDGSTAALRAAVWAVDEAVSPTFHCAWSTSSITMRRPTWTPTDLTGITRRPSASRIGRGRRSKPPVGRSSSKWRSCAGRRLRCWPKHLDRQRWYVSVGRATIVPREGTSRPRRRPCRNLPNAPLLALTTGRDHDLADTDTDTEQAVRTRLERHLARHSAHASEVSICSLPVGHGALDYLAKNAGLAQLAVVGADDPGLVLELTNAESVLNQTNCSVMSVRGHVRQ